MKAKVNEPRYLKIARQYIGVKEVPGPKHNSVIQGWLKSLKLWWNDDETAWCGVFVAAVMQESGLDFPKAFYRAKEWANYGVKLPGPYLGAIAVLERVGGGHVGFVTGVDKTGQNVRLLGGNQNNQVCEAWFKADRIKAYRMPNCFIPDKTPIAVVGTFSESEA